MQSFNIDLITIRNFLFQKYFLHSNNIQVEQGLKFKCKRESHFDEKRTCGSHYEIKCALGPHILM